MYQEQMINLELGELQICLAQENPSPPFAKRSSYPSRPEYNGTKLDTPKNQVF